MDRLPTRWTELVAWAEELDGRQVVVGRAWRSLPRPVREEIRRAGLVRACRQSDKIQGRGRRPPKADRLLARLVRQELGHAADLIATGKKSVGQALRSVNLVGEFCLHLDLRLDPGRWVQVDDSQPFVRVYEQAYRDYLDRLDGLKADGLETVKRVLASLLGRLAEADQLARAVDRRFGPQYDQAIGEMDGWLRQDVSLTVGSRLGRQRKRQAVGQFLARLRPRGVPDRLRAVIDRHARHIALALSESW